MSSPLRVPTPIKIAEGNPGKQKLPVNDPQPKELPTINPPDFLSVEAKTLCGFSPRNTKKWDCSSRPILGIQFGEFSCRACLARQINR